MGSNFVVMLPAKETVVENEFEACFDVKGRLVNSINVELSDIYL